MAIKSSKTMLISEEHSIILIINDIMMHTMHSYCRNVYYIIYTLYDLYNYIYIQYMAVNDISLCKACIPWTFEVAKGMGLDHHPAYEN